MSVDPVLQTVSIDHGAGNIKIATMSGVVVIPSRVAVASGETLRRVTGLRSTRPPARIRLDGHEFYIGEHAHDWGRPVENLDDGRFAAGDPATVALVYAALSEVHVQLPYNLEMIVGLPQSALAGDAATATTRGLRGWLRGRHEWTADGHPRSATVADVTITSQAAGALFDYFLARDGKFVEERRPEFINEVAVLSVGMNTLEMLVTERGAIKQRFTESEALGVRRLLELCDPAGLYSRGELDAALRAGALDTTGALPVWIAEIAGRLEARWGRALRRFRRVIIVGGGALLLREQLTDRFTGRAYIPDDPVGSVARGLYKLALMRAG